jgi:NAD(P)H-hydrate epimerase
MLAPLYTAEEMKAAEAGHDVPALMNRAGAAVAEEALRRFPDARTFVLHAGSGANGGDGKIAARLLEERGVRRVEDDAEAQLVIDALLGTGMRGAPREETAREIERINASPAPVVAVDIPSGVDASTGEVAGAAVHADLTVTMHGPKVGLVVGPGGFLAGEVVVADIGLEPRETEHRLVLPEILSLVSWKRPRDNKYSAGSVLVVGGARGTTGAAALTARAAFRADAGYVAIAAPVDVLPTLETLVLEAVKRPLEEALAAAERASALALGPGLGREQKALVRRLLEATDVPAVVDADALHELEPFERSAPTVLTPHSGELSRLLDVESAWVDAHRLDAVRHAVERYGCFVLLKGADTLIGSPGEGTWVVGGDAPSLATAGSGDVLTGIVAAFLAKGMGARDAAAAATVAQRRAAAAGPERGLIASDVIEALPGCLAPS